MSNRAPTFGEVLKAFMRSERRTMFGGWMPGRIESYDKSKRKASVLLLIKEPFTHEDGTEDSELMPVIHEVPVQMPGDSLGTRILLDVKKGDNVTVLFASRSTDRWVQQGGIVEPGDLRDHDLNDAVCFPGLADFAHVKAPTAKIEFTSTTVEVGGSAQVAMKTDLDAFKNGIIARIAVLTPGLPGTATEIATLNAILSALPPGWPVASQVLKGA